MRLFGCFAVAWIASTIGSADAQEAAPFESQHYRVVAERSQSLAREVAERMERIRAKGFAALLPFEPPAERKLRIHVLASREAFDRYRKTKHRDEGDRFGFPFFDYPGERAGDREIVAFEMDPVPFYERLFEAGWRQHLAERIAHPPPWVRDGLAEYFAGWRLNEKEEPEYQSNRSMLRRLREGMLGMEEGVLKGFYRKRTVAEALGLDETGWRVDSEGNAAVAWGVWAWLRDAGDGSPLQPKTILQTMEPSATSQKNLERCREALLGKRKPEEVQKEFEKFVRDLKLPGDEDFRRGVAELKAEKTRAALLFLRKAVEADTDCARYWHFLGSAYYESGDDANAATCFRNATKLFPEYVSSWVMLARTEYAAGRTAEGGQAADEAARFDPRVAPDMAALKAKHASAKPPK